MVARVALLACSAAAFMSASPRGPASLAPARTATALNAAPVYKTVSQTIQEFEEGYKRPIITLWRSPLNDMLQTTHLSVVNADYKYDPFFAYGFLELMDLIMSSYPVPAEGDKITDALISALDFEPATIRADRAAIQTWVEGKTEADCLAAAGAGSGSPVADAAAIVKGRANPDYFHTRPGNVGLLTLMDKVGVKADKESIERWAAAFGYRERPVSNMSGLLKEYQDKIANAMQMIKAMEIREKKRMADALEEKAKAAQAKAEAASSSSADKASGDAAPATA